MMVELRLISEIIDSLVGDAGAKGLEVIELLSSSVLLSIENLLSIDLSVLSENSILELLENVV